MARADKNLEECLCPTENLLENPAHANGVAHDLGGITKIVYRWVHPLELANHESRVRSHPTKHNNHQNTRDEAKLRERPRKGEDAK